MRDHKELFCKTKTPQSRLSKIVVLWILVIISLTVFSSSLVFAKPIVLVQVIEAQQGEMSKVSPELKSIETRLQSTFKDYNQFVSLSDHSVDLEAKKEHTIEVTKDLEFILSLSKQTERNIELEISIPKHRTRHKVMARVGRLFFEAIKSKDRVILLAIRPSL